MLYSVVYARPISFWGSGILLCVRQKVPMSPAAYKNPELWVPNEPPWWAMLHTWCQSDAGVPKCILCDSRERGLLNASNWLPPDFDHTSCFPFADFTLYPFTVISHSHEFPANLSSSGEPPTQVITM